MQRLAFSRSETHSVVGIVQELWDAAAVGVGEVLVAGELTDFEALAGAFHELGIGAGGIASSLMIHGIWLPPVLATGSEEMKQQVAPPVLAGEKVIGKVRMQRH